MPFKQMSNNVNPHCALVTLRTPQRQPRDGPDRHLSIVRADLGLDYLRWLGGFLSDVMGTTSASGIASCAATFLRANSCVA